MILVPRIFHSTIIMDAAKPDAHSSHFVFVAAVLPADRTAGVKVFRPIVGDHLPRGIEVLASVGAGLLARVASGIS